MAVPFCWAAAIFILYSVPGFDLDYEDPWRWVRFDKLTHIGMFAILVITLIVAFRKQNLSRFLRLHAKKSTLLFAILYGGILEVMQEPVFIQRTSDSVDFFANTIGALAGVLLFRMIYGRRLARA